MNHDSAPAFGGGLDFYLCAEGGAEGLFEGDHVRRAAARGSLADGDGGPWTLNGRREWFGVVGFDPFVDQALGLPYRESFRLDSHQESPLLLFVANP